MDSYNGVILTVVPKGFLYKHIEGITLSACGKRSSTAKHFIHKNIVKLLCILRIVEHAVDVCASVIK